MTRRSSAPGTHDAGNGISFVRPDNPITDSEKRPNHDVALGIALDHAFGTPAIVTRRRLYEIIHNPQKHQVLGEFLLLYLRPEPTAFGRLAESAVEGILRMHPHFFHANDALMEIDEHAKKLRNLLSEVKRKRKARLREIALFEKYVRGDISAKWPGCQPTD
ncbi:MAG: hypothetical protein LVQ95_00645 [Candidatus Micrarchaeales archaeon]|nr:hypothetical protein [Candidatus Micrarchaeales archaeon]